MHKDICIIDNSKEHRADILMKSALSFIEQNAEKEGSSINFNTTNFNFKIIFSDDYKKDFTNIHLNQEIPNDIPNGTYIPIRSQKENACCKDVIIINMNKLEKVSEYFQISTVIHEVAHYIIYNTFFTRILDKCKFDDLRPNEESPLLQIFLLYSETVSSLYQNYYLMQSIEQCNRAYDTFQTNFKKFFRRFKSIDISNEEYLSELKKWDPNDRADFDYPFEKVSELLKNVPGVLLEQKRASIGNPN